MTRKEARDNLFKLIFQYEAHKSMPQDHLGLFYEIFDVDEKSKEYIDGGFNGVMENITEIDRAISESSQGWQLSRISKVALAALRLFVYESMFGDIPESVAANEAVELVKKYDLPEAAAFTNAVISKILK